MRRVLLLSLVCLGAPALLRAQISPGPLARPHAKLEGTLQCAKCHAGGRGRSSEQMSGQCLSCHKEIAWLADRERGLHGSAPVKAQRCASCHPDHAGVDFDLISWRGLGGSEERFEHTRAGWPLEGSHARQKCAACHKPAFRVSSAARLSQRPKSDPGWLGLERSCTSCHEDVHRGALAQNCLKCHDVEHWKPAPRFDHAKTNYALTGAHERVKCAACHEAPQLRLASDARGRPIPRYKPLEHRECVACHTDVHKGKLGAACSRCHQTSSFKTINRASFDHDRTRYPLRGRHIEVACEKCHDFSSGNVASTKPFATCSGCHTPDPHAGFATLGGRVVDCTSCHTVDGWRPSIFTVAQHRQTKYPLEQSHAQAKCGDCHTKTTGASTAAMGVVIMRPATGCVNCHVDPHAGKLTRCEDCHDLGAFHPARIDVAEHRRYSFPLEGAHRAVPCVKCHQAMQRSHATSTLRLAGWTGAPVLFDAPPGGCRGCHEDVHGGQFNKRPGGGACERCHDVTAFRPASGFDHERDAAFSLKGAHAKVPCERCHKPGRGAGGQPLIVYRGVPSACEACHR